MTEKRRNVPIKLRDAAEKAIKFNADQIRRMEHQVEHLSEELRRARRENQINLKASSNI